MSEFVVSARKYRPGSFQELVGQSHVSQTLKNAIKNEKIAHSFLFCGPRGTGKTSSARILARILNCEDLGDDIQPCNTCGSCTAFADNASFNIAELDAASNNSVDAIRNLNDQVRVPPQNGKYRIFIIDEVHMLSQAAFNAFLKTLEEPPPYAIFILATTEKHKILPTILSRCQIFDFKRIEVSKIIARLKEICQNETITASEDALHLIAQKADGAMRDALSIFDKIVSFSEKEITYEGVLSQLNILDYDYYFKVVEALQIEDMSKVLLLFDEIVQSGFEAETFINGLSSHLRDLLVCKDEATVSLLELSDTLKDRYKTQATSCPSGYLLNLLNICNECSIHFKMAKNKRLHVEMALIKMSYVKKLISGTPIQVKKNTSLNVGQSNVQTPPKQESVSVAPKESPKPITPPISKPAAEPEIPKIVIPDSMKMGAIATIDSLTSVKSAILEKEASEKAQALELTMDHLSVEWEDYASKASSPSVQNTLRNAKIQIENGDIRALVGSAMAQEFIRKELKLTERLRSKFGRHDLRLTVSIDPAMAKAKKQVIKKPLSVKERYDAMVAVNPLVDKMRVHFDLKLDNN